MPKRKRPALLQPKKSKKHRKMTKASTIFVGGEPTAPTREEWTDDTRMHSIGHFQVVGAHNEVSMFKLGDYAIILPENKTVADKAKMRIGHYWSGKIREIKVRNNDIQNEVWAKVQWLYDPSEVATVLKKRNGKELPMGEYGRMERLLSDHFDFVHTTCFEDTITVSKYDELAERPNPIHGEDDLFYRATFNATQFSIENRLRKTCLCKEPYDPDAEDVAMHFCARCSKSYHAKCLQKSQSVVQDVRRTEIIYPSERQMAMELSFTRIRQKENGIARKDPLKQPDTSSQFPDQHSTARDPSVSMDESDVTKEEFTSWNWDRYNLLPPELISLARSPMVKGRGTKLPSLWTVSGNLAFVSRAREIVDDVVRPPHPISLPEKWESIVAVPESSDGSPSSLLAWVVDDPGFQCPKCGYPI